MAAVWQRTDPPRLAWLCGTEPYELALPIARAAAADADKILTNGPRVFADKPNPYWIDELTP